MKIRNGFVSNSSSTSYIVAIQKVLSDCPHCKRTDINIIEYLQNTNDSDNSAESLSSSELISATLSNDYLKKDEKNKTIKKLQSYDDTWNFARISISYHDETAGTIFENLKSNGNLEIIRSEI